MPSIPTTRRLLTVYADKLPWTGNYDESKSCLDVEEKLAWGVHIFKGLLDLEARTQANALKKPTPEAEQLMESMPLFYKLWMEASEFYVERARAFQGPSYTVDGLDELQETIEEARCLLENMEVEEQIRPIEESIRESRPENPRPDRYKD